MVVLATLRVAKHRAGVAAFADGAAPKTDLAGVVNIVAAGNHESGVNHTTVGNDRAGLC